MTTPEPNAVAAAAATIVDAFAATDTERYLAGFSPDATFNFHSEPHRLEDRAAYERLWSEWLETGRSVVSCASTDSRVQVFDGGAVFSHTVATQTRTAGREESYRERETIVFALEGERLIAAHEHLSPFPETARPALVEIV